MWLNIGGVINGRKKTKSKSKRLPTAASIVPCLELSEMLVVNSFYMGLLDTEFYAKMEELDGTYMAGNSRGQSGD